MVKGIIMISGDAPSEFKKMLADYGEVRSLPPYERLPAPVMSHCDMLMCRVGGKLYVWKEYLAKNSSLFDGIADEVVPAEGMPSYIYPGDVGLDLLTLKYDTLCFGHEKTACPEVCEHISKLGGIFVPVRQGYTRCSVLKITETDIITADEGIAREASGRRVSALMISPGQIALPGYDSGFIGGASGIIGKNVLFFGDLNAHRDAPQIKAFAERRGMKCLDLPGIQLTDVGGIYYLERAAGDGYYNRHYDDNKPRVSERAKTDFWDLGTVARDKRLTGFTNDTNAVQVDLPLLENDIMPYSGEKLPGADSRKWAEKAVSLGLERIKRAREEKNSVRIKEPEAEPENRESSFHMQEAGSQYSYLNNRPIEVYVPQNPLISEVSVYLWRSKYTFYDRFARDAERYYSYKPKNESEPVHFFSYIPQYSQMNRQQLEWYFCWREKVRNGEYPAVDFPYIQLLAAEIVNLPELISGREGLSLLTALWKNYRGEYAKLDQLMCETITDYCLINNLLPPVEEMGEELFGAAGRISKFPEFWQRSDEGGERAAELEYLLRRCSKYDYRRSKFYAEGGEDIKKAYDTHIKNALAAACDAGAVGRVRSREVSYSRSSYSNLSCAWKNHRSISIKYKRFIFSDSESNEIADAVRYSENKLREMLRIRGRLSVTLPNCVSVPIDKYFAPLIADSEYGMSQPKKREDSVDPEFEAYYEPLHSDLSRERAAEIERESWRITDALTAAEEQVNEKTYGDDQEHLAAENKNAPEEKESDSTDRNAGAEESPDSTVDLVKNAVRLLLDGDSEGFRGIAKDNNLLPEALLDLVNETLYPVIGDAAAEYDGVRFAAVADYGEELCVWLGN